MDIGKQSQCTNNWIGTHVKDKKHFCYEIYKNLSIWSKNGQLSYNPCSAYDGYIKTTDQFDLSVWNGPEHARLKQMVANDQEIFGCHSCRKQEAHGMTSRRQGSQQLYEVYFKDTDIDLTGPQSIDYSVGNLCNLKCVICGPKNSTAWLPDYQKLYPLASIEQFRYDKFNQIEVNDTELLKNIKNVHFHGGGEPLLSNNHVNLLTKIQQVKGLDDVHVFYNTNGTVRASSELLELWSQCQLVELYFSIDDVGPRFNYQRTGADWNMVLDNLRWYYDAMPVNHMFKINCVWGYLNLYYLDQLVDWHHNEFNTNRLGDPVDLIFQRANGEYGIDRLPQTVITELQSRFANYPTILELVHSIARDDQQKHTQFWRSITQLDVVRQTDFARLCPEWSKILKQ